MFDVHVNKEAEISPSPPFRSLPASTRSIIENQVLDTDAMHHRVGCSGGGGGSATKSGACTCSGSSC